MYQSLFLYLSLIITATKETINVFDIRAIIQTIESGAAINKISLQKDLSGSLYCELKKQFKEKSEVIHILISFFCVQLNILGIIKENKV